MVRGGRRAWWVGVVFLLLGTYTWASEMTYAPGSTGMCFGFMKTLPTRTKSFCAMACSANSVCNAFFYQSQICSLYEYLVQPGSSTVDCYVPAEALTANLPSAADLPTPPPPTTHPPNSLSTTTTSSGAASTVDLTNVSELRVTLQQKCATNGGIIGIFKDSVDFYFLCRMSPNEIPLVVSNPGSSCSGDEISCLTTTCGADKIFIGYDQNGPMGPCYTISSTQATVDKTDCYDETTAAPLPAGKGGTWTQWRICRTDEFFVVVAADVASGTIASITCCRAKAV